jgi:hypothetical protein
MRYGSELRDSMADERGEKHKMKNYLWLTTLAILTIVAGCLGEVASGKESIVSMEEGLIFIENLRDPHPIPDIHPQNLDLIQFKLERDKVTYEYVFRGAWSQGEQEIKRSGEGEATLGRELEYQGIKAYIGEAEGIPGVPMRGKAYRVTTAGKTFGVSKKRYGVGFFSDQTLLISRKFKGDEVEFYVMPIGSCGVINVRGHNLSVALDKSLYPPMRYDYVVPLDRDYAPIEILELDFEEPMAIAFSYFYYPGVKYDPTALTLIISSLASEYESRAQHDLYCSGRGPSAALIVKKLIISQPKEKGK